MSCPCEWQATRESRSRGQSSVHLGMMGPYGRDEGEGQRATSTTLSSLRPNLFPSPSMHPRACATDEEEEQMSGWMGIGTCHVEAVESSSEGEKPGRGRPRLRLGAARSHFRASPHGAASIPPFTPTFLTDSVLVSYISLCLCMVKEKCKITSDAKRGRGAWSGRLACALARAGWN